MIHDDFESKMKAALKPAKDAELKASPYLRTRVLANLRNESQKQGVLKWILSSFALGGALAGLIVFVLMKGPQKNELFHGALGEPMLVKVEVQDLKAEIVQVKIELPDGVAFYSKNHPELNETRGLVIAWDKVADKSKLPFIVKASEPGIKKIKILFLDKNDNVAQEETLEIDFKSKG